VSAVFRESDEALERGLFERRARARRGAAGVPALDAVLRAARDDARETSGGRGRAWTGLALAAACLVTVVKTRPHDGSPRGIAADVDGAASGYADRAGGLCEERAFSASMFDSTYAGMALAAPIAQEGRACVSPPATFEPSRTLSCDRDEANRTEMP
jgi:hypothetical protein